MTKPKFPDAVSLGLPAFPDKVSGPIGIGRPKGSRNRQTLVMKDAMTAVFNDLQAETGRPYGHMFDWGKENPTDFYKLCGRLIPYQVDASVDGPVIGNVVFVRSVAELDRLSEAADD